MLLLETCVTPGDHMNLHLTRETETFDQAIGIVGCRPTRPWIMDVLRKYYGHAYVTKTQPNHKDFDLDWQVAIKKQNHRSVFVGSKKPIENPLLLVDLPDLQMSFGFVVATDLQPLLNCEFDQKFFLAPFYQPPFFRNSFVA